LKTGEQKIREKEEKIKMIELELKDRQRQLRVVHSNIPLVPKLSAQLIGLKKNVDDTKTSVE
jgi:chromosome segregation ATPase